MSDDQCFKILYYFSKLLGLAPFAVSKKAPNLKTEISYSYKGNIYNCLLISIGLCLTIYCDDIVINFDFPSKSDFVLTLITSKSIIGGVSLIVLWISICVQQTIVVKIHQKLSEIDKVSKNSVSSVETSVKTVVALHYGFNILIWISIMITDELVFGTFFSFIWIAMNIACFIGSWFIIQYAFIAHFLKKRFQELNYSFENLANEISPLNEVKIVNEFLQLKNLYSLLYEMVQKLSDFYSFPIFIITTYFCGSIVYTSYYCLHPFVYPTEDYTFLLSVNSIQYLIMEWFPIIVLTINITSLSNEMKLVDIMVYKLMNRCTGCNELLMQIKKFSMTLLMRENQFTAYNFFPIDCTLLHTIISTTATYLIILFQFQDESKEDVGKVTTQTIE